MEPNKWGLIRQKDLNLLALMFLNALPDIENFEIEEVPISYLDGSFYTAAGNVGVNENAARGSAKVSGYTYIAYPCSLGNNVNATSGLRQNPDSGPFSNYLTVAHAHSSGPDFAGSAYNVAIPVNYEQYVCVSASKNFKPPVIGFRRHRSDNVNPKGLTSNVGNILQNSKEDKLNPDTIRRDNLSDNSEESVIDS